jgi:ribosome biogenesis protein SSF1/2
MARQGGRSARRKKQSAVDKQAGKPKDSNPKSMVLRVGAGEVGSSVSQLVTDVRHVMEPDTAIRLKVSCPSLLLQFSTRQIANFVKERRHNKIRDYLTMCGPLGVSHLLLFSRSETGNTNLRLGRVPRGPTCDASESSSFTAANCYKQSSLPS